MESTNDYLLSENNILNSLWMMRWKFFLVLLFGIVFNFKAMAFPVKTSPSIRVVSEYLPPYQFYDEQNRLTGLSVDIIRALMAKTMQHSQIEILPWSEAYQLATERENVLIFSIVRSKERMNQFKWVGDILKLHYYFTTLKSRDDISISNIQDVKKYVTGVAHGSFEYELLNRYGFASGRNLQINTEQFPLINQLLKGEIDMIFGSNVTVVGMMNYINKDMNKLKFAYQLNETPGSLGIAFSLKTSDEVVERFRHGFELIKNDGTVDRVIHKWLKHY